MQSLHRNSEVWRNEVSFHKNKSQNLTTGKITESFFKLNRNYFLYVLWEMSTNQEEEEEETITTVCNHFPLFRRSVK